ncbi:hypothetical protein E8E12_004238 [Didymella heteroderae]|uniref:Uncharacterized protein n=1 Tax=Didymella heteroderae TaxID=1769908 RepID=A0A9P5BWF2_9PLEO|nr:hypothetical protein E8E12_004238 [Didymella heteroderae]
MAPKPLNGPGNDLFQAPIPMLDLAQPTIPFQKMPLPNTTLTFLPRSGLPESRKRGRAAADVDGERSCPHKKKRRLRLFLITSRLSPQFSHPATNIVDRGSSKIAVWAKQRSLGRNLLRKAAILNRIRRSAVAAREEVSHRRLLVEQEKEQRELEMARLTFKYGAIDTYTRPVHLQPVAPPFTALWNDTPYLNNRSSPTGSQSGSPVTSRSPSPSSVSPPTGIPGTDSPPEYRSPNAAYALSPPRAQSSHRSYEPHLPSPLGLSNYDAFDAESLGAKNSSAVDLYSHFDDDNNEGQYSYLWDEVDDEPEDARHDSPFSPSAVTNDSRSTTNTGTSRALKTPPQVAHHDVDISETLLGRLEEHDADSAWPSPFLGAALKPISGKLPADDYRVQGKRGAGGASPSFRAFDAGPLAVQYPGAPVPCTEQVPAMVPPVLSPCLVPASMSPNFLPADAEGWPGTDERDQG